MHDFETSATHTHIYWPWLELETCSTESPTALYTVHWLTSWSTQQINKYWMFWGLVHFWLTIRMLYSTSLEIIPVSLKFIHDLWQWRSCMWLSFPTHWQSSMWKGFALPVFGTTYRLHVLLHDKSIKLACFRL